MTFNEFSQQLGNESNGSWAEQQWEKNLEVYSHTNWSVRLQSRIKEQTASVESVINGG